MSETPDGRQGGEARAEHTPDDPSVEQSAPGEQPALTVEQRARAVIDSIRPYIQADGGDIDFVGLTDGVVQVRLRGSCSGCPHAAMTLKMGVERHLRMYVPEITAVENVG